MCELDIDCFSYTAGSCLGKAWQGIHKSHITQYKKKHYMNKHARSGRKKRTTHKKGWKKALLLWKRWNITHRVVYFSVAWALSESLIRRHWFWVSNCIRRGAMMISWWNFSVAAGVNATRNRCKRKKTIYTESDKINVQVSVYILMFWKMSAP